MKRSEITRRLLDLQTEYARYEEMEARTAEFGMAPERGPEQIAAEYEEALTAFISAS